MVSAQNYSSQRLWYCVVVGVGTCGTVSSSKKRDLGYVFRLLASDLQLHIVEWKVGFLRRVHCAWNGMERLRENEKILFGREFDRVPMYWWGQPQYQYPTVTKHFWRFTR